MATSDAPRTGPSVVVLAYDRMSAFELGIVSEVFGVPLDGFDRPWYELTICAERPGPVPIVGGAALHTPYGLERFETADTIIIPGVADTTGEVPPAVVAALRAAHRRGARIVSICSGSFALAAAGLLDGRRATTHWRFAERMRTRFPLVEVDSDVLYVDGTDVLTGAGSAAGLDLCVHLVRLDFGPTTANAVARRLVIQPHRDGGQAQFIRSPVADVPEDDRVAATIAWALEHLDEPITVASLAARAHLSERSYLRHFRYRAGTSPIRWLIGQRVQASLALLERGDTPIDQIATSVGFETTVTYRHHFGRTMRTSPSAYRRAFRTTT